MKIFSENPGRMVAGYSREFESSFLSLLRVRGPKQKVFANQIYQEMIKDRNHVHMKATCWTTLSGFVQYLGKTGKAIIEEAPRGWYITYVETDPDVLEKQRKARDLEKMELDEQQRNERRVQKQVDFAYKAKSESSKDKEDRTSSHDLVVESDKAPVKVEFKTPAALAKGKRAVNVFAKEEEEVEEENGLKEDMHKEETKSEEEFAWICPNIVVKVLNPDLDDGNFYKQKGVIIRVYEHFIAEIQMLKIDAVIKIDQVELETVLPAPGNEVLFVGKGNYHGLRARLEGIDEKSFSARITFLEGEYNMKTVDGIEYDQICKVHEKKTSSSK